MATLQEIRKSNIQFFPGKVDVNPKGGFFKQFKSSKVIIGDLEAQIEGRLTANLTDGIEWAHVPALALTDDGIIQGSVGNFAEGGYYLLMEIIRKKDLDSQLRLVSARLTVANLGVFPPFVYHPDHPTAPWVIETWTRSQQPKEGWHLMAKPEASVLGLVRGSLRVSHSTAH